MLDQKYVRECFIYNPSTGELIWRARPREHFEATKARTIEHARANWNSRFAGTEAGSLKISGRSRHRSVQVAGKRYYAHRLIYLYMSGEFPENDTDHIDHDGLNNRWSNIRSVTHGENQQNHPLRSDNTSGVTGVYWRPRAGKWYVSINFRGEQKSLGHFSARADAIAARKDAEVKYGFHINHGKQAA